MIAAAESGAAGRLRRSEVSDYWTRKALRFLRERPPVAAALFVKKAYLLVNDFEVSNNQGIYYFRRYSAIFSALGHFGFGVLLPLAAAGAMLMRWNRRLLLLPLFLGSYGLSVVLFFVTDRYRIPLVPVLMLPAGLALVRAGEALHGKRDGRLAGAGALFVACAILAGSNLYHLDRNQEAQGRFNAGVARMEAGKLTEAAEEFGAALRERPDYASARYNLGLCRSYLGDLALARTEFETLLRDHPDHAEGRRALASVAAREGDRDEALRHLDEAIRLNPSFVDALRARADLLEEAGRSEEAERDRERAREVLERTASLIRR
jgi:tetratricopeptide (TPR) repeat protein